MPGTQHSSKGVNGYVLFQACHIASLPRVNVMIYNKQTVESRMIESSAWVLMLSFLLNDCVAVAGPATPSIKDAKNFFVIYMENHSFDNRFGSWEDVNGRIGTYT